MYLTVERGLRTGHSVSLDGTLAIGSAADADLRLEDPGVQLEHAVVKPLKGGGFGIKSMDGAVVVNGNDVTAARLVPGARFSIGGVELSVHDGDVAAPGEEGVERDEAVEIVPTSPAPTARGGEARDDRMLGGYRLLDQLGKGGMGVVYRAEQVSLSREVALKVLSKDLTVDPMFVGRFVAEARHAARMHHPNVVQVFDVDHEGDTYFYPMELMEESLERLVRRSGKLDPDRAVAVIRDAASGLAYAESLGLVHRDIKPDNIMLDRHGTAKLCDLGLAQATDDEDSGKIAGTPHFMAPEQILRKPVDHRSDLYALGCTFYRILTGSTPFRGKSVKEIVRAQVKETPLAPHKEDPDVPAELSPVVLKLLEKDPDDRYQSAQQLVEALDALTAPVQRKWVAPVAAVLTLAAVGIAIWFATRDPEVIVKPADVKVDEEALREAERLRAEQRESNARIELLGIQNAELSPTQLAARYEELAANTSFSGTAAAIEAAELAETLRAEIARREAAAAARAAAVQTAIEGLNESANTAIEARRWDQALAALSLEGIAADLREEEAITTARDRLRTALQTAVTAAVQERMQVVGATLEGTDTAAIRAAAAELAEAFTGPEAWPGELLGDTEPMRALVTRAEALADEIDRNAEQAATAAAWHTFGVTSSEILQAQVHELAFSTAAERWRTLATELGDQPAAERARALAEASQWAESVLAAIEARIDPETEGMAQITLDDGTLAPVASLTRTGASAGVVVLVGPKSRRKEIAVARSAMSLDKWRELLPEPASDAERWAQTAFMGWLALDRCRTEAEAWLARLDPQDDASGTGEQGYDFAAHEFDRTIEAVGTAPPEWMERFVDELRAARHLAAGMQAVSDRRNRAGQSLVRSVLENSPHALAVVGLR